MVHRLGLVVSLVVALGGVCAPQALAAGSFFMRGGGWGHGIGMSQYGADGYALHGADYRAILAHYYTGTALGQTNPKQTVRVLLGTGNAAFAGATLATTPGAPAKTAKKLNPGSTYTVKVKANGSLVLVGPNGKQVGAFAAPLAASGPGPLSVAGLGSYRGSLEFRPDGNGGVQTVDALGLDDYIRGVIAGEVPASWPSAALEAQAVAARTYAITASVAGNGYTLYPDTRSQMYQGVAAETAATEAAVAATNGQIVTYHGSPAVTYFFSSSGGYTENIENVWSAATPEPWLRGVPDPYDSAGGSNPYYRWTYTLSLPTAQRRLGSLVRGSLVGIRVLSHGVSPRIVQALVVGTRGSTQVTGSQLEGALQLPSTYAAFTTVSTYAGLASRTARDRRTRGRLARVHLPRGWGFTALLEAVAAPAHGVHGTVFPGRPGDAIAIQQAVGRSWRTVVRARLGRGGSFSLRVPKSGRYRVVYGGLNGPAVTVS